MTFEEYCVQKKINAAAFKKAEAGQYSNLKQIFEQIHPNSFTAQKLFLLNNLRLSYPLAESQIDSSKTVKAKRPKPKFNIPKK